MRLLIALLTLLAVVLPVGVVLFALYRATRVQGSRSQQLFRRGRLPSPTPDGFYRGASDLWLARRWVGKMFRAIEGTGVNVLRCRGREVTAYPFTCHAARGLADPKLEVLALDYGRPDNPWWLRRLVDELVEVAPGKYLGKVHLRLPGGRPWSLAYFWLER